MKPKLVKPRRINEILDNCIVFTKTNFVCAARWSDMPILSYPAGMLVNDNYDDKVWHNTQDLMCNNIEHCSTCFLQQRNILNIIKYIKKNKLHTKLCYTKKTTKQ